MSLVRLMYYSTASSALSLTDIKKILTTARENNQRLDICGMLCYDNQYFLQALEGDREIVSELFVTIAEDPRHDEVVIVSYDYIEEQTFKSWQMGYAGSNSLLSTLLGKLKLTQFEPGKLTPNQCFAILTTLSKQQEDL